MAGMTDDRYAVARAVLSQLPCPVVIVGAADGARRSCSTGTAMYVSFAPAALAIAQHPGSRTTALIEASGEFSVTMLRDDQIGIATDAGRSGSGEDKFVALGLPVLPPPDGLQAPAIGGGLAAIWCRVTARHLTGDHVLFVGEVAASTGSPGGTALLRHQRRYARLGSWLSDEAPEGYPT